MRANQRPASGGNPRTVSLRSWDSAEERGRGGFPLTRRQFLIAAGAAGVLALGAAGGYSLVNAQKAQAKTDSLDVPESAVTAVDSLAELPAEGLFEPELTLEMPFGTLVFAEDSSTACCLVPTGDPRAIVRIEVLDLASGDSTIALEGPVGAAEGFEVLDARANSQGAVWVEASMLEGRWRIYASPLRSGAASSPRLLDEGSSDTETPSIATAGSCCVWQRMVPASAENASSAEAAVMAADFSGGEARTLLSATGRFSCPVSSSGELVAVCPRSPHASGAFRLMALDPTDGTVRDQLALPAGMKPNAIGYGAHGFSFCFEGIYDFGGGIANLGTYTPLRGAGEYEPAASDPTATDDERAGARGAADLAALSASTDRYSALPWLRFGKTPQTSPCWLGGSWFLVKSTYGVVATNVDSQAYCSLGSENGAADWGDFLASSGQVNRAVTFSHIDHTNSAGDTEKVCRVRIWKAPASAGA